MGNLTKTIELDLQFQGYWWPLKGQILAIFHIFAHFYIQFLGNGNVIGHLKHLKYLVVMQHLFGVLHCFQHCTGHITTGSWKGRGNQYIQLVKVLFCKLPTKLRSQRWEARVLPLCHHGPHICLKY